jgi:O-succinylbenzoate synthase
VSARIELRWRVVRWRYDAGAFAAGFDAATAAADGGQRTADGGRRTADSESGRESVLVEARSADGTIGLGEAAPLPGRSSDAIADVIRALEPLQTSGAGSEVWRITRDVASPAARFAVETALLGVLAAQSAVDLAHLIDDASPNEVPTAIVVDDVAAARRAYAAGARCLKLKVGAGDDRARIAAIAAAAPEARLRLDANRSWPAAEVVARLEALRVLPIDFIEEPCARIDQLIGRRFALPIALDESLADADTATLDALLAWPAVGALVVKPTILGGIAHCRELAARVAVPVVVSHALEGPIGSAACAELARALAGDCVRGLVRPAGVGAHPALARWKIGVPQLQGARVVRAQRPGLGFEGLDLDAAFAAVPV